MAYSLATGQLLTEYRELVKPLVTGKFPQI